MRSLMWHGKFDVRPEAAPIPTLGQEEALIKVSRAGICGSDMLIYMGKHWRAKAPLIMGHEFGGEIVEVRSSRTSLKPGDQVAVEPLLSCGDCYACREGAYHVCNTLGLLGIDADGGFAEYVKAPVNRIYRLPESVPAEMSSMVEPLAVAVHAVKRSRVKLGSDVVVLGAGPIGLLVAQVARVACGKQVDITEVSDWRIDFASKLGFEAIDVKKVDLKQEVLARTDGRGADVLFDVAGVSATSRLQPHITRIHGQVVQVAMTKEDLPVDLAAYALREIDLTGVRVYDYSDYRSAIDLIADHKIDVESLVSHVLPLEQGREGLELAMKADVSMKVLLQP